MHGRFIFIEARLVLTAAFVLGGSVLLGSTFIAFGLYEAAKVMPAPVIHNHTPALPPAVIHPAEVPINVQVQPNDQVIEVRAEMPKAPDIWILLPDGACVKGAHLPQAEGPYGAAAGRGVPAAAPSAASTLEALDIGQYGTLLPKPKDVK